GAAKVGTKAAVLYPSPGAVPAAETAAEVSTRIIVLEIGRIRIVIVAEQGGTLGVSASACAYVVESRLASEVAAGGLVVPWRPFGGHSGKRACTMAAEHRTDRIQKQRAANHSGGRGCGCTQE